MPETPQFFYFLSSSDHPITSELTIWKSPLPLSRKVVKGHLETEDHISITHGDYFHSVRSFLKKDRFEILTSAVSQYLDRDIEPDDIQEIRICLEKHGEFYHPARVAVDADGKSVSLVVNVAVSHAGKSTLQREYKQLERLNRDYPRPFIPKVYGQGDINIEEPHVIASMFLGEWFKGFNEFHLSRDKSDDKIRLIVWDPVQDNFFLTPDQAKELYSQAAKILTYYYNMESFEQISLWHHAAGDFVVNLKGGKVDLRLVTVRKYASMFENSLTNNTPPGD